MGLEPRVIEELVAQRRRFLAFLAPRVGSPEEAEEVLQLALVRGLEKGGGLRDEESAVAWFYRLLRNVLVDRHRRAAREERALEVEAADAPRSTEDVGAWESSVCACVAGLAGTLKPEYAAILQAVDLKGTPVAAFARQEGLTANNAAVRLHRARQALGKRLIALCGTCCTHGCVDCACGPDLPRVADVADE
ncbi:sigma-70 family RNA polymerase sigma factor [Myxococcus stipitatus]|uniref:RNA polymerase sigma factor n=1 Tax=Myxococcus stipitatus TaxID=83455 RepID=UPI001F18C235|nr:sigma-70 family RNA polymerase sigma factor [Myxococcus stipitatus]MCE9673288.1 sigma-70 family RNA polymerase sigma factor [Myxococcus stipitatus]